MGERSLEDFVESVQGESHLRIEHDFGDGFVRLRTSEAERRQAAQDIRNVESIVLELLRNSRDAHAKNIFVAATREGDKRLLTVIDDGDGIPATMHAHVFEPRVTSKLDTNHMDAWGMHGRGMALYSIKVNVDEAYVASSAPGLGCAMRVSSAASRLAEKADQSTFPRFEIAESGEVNVRGPRNILRTACEFAIESRDSCSVHVGSATEIASTLYSYGLATLSAIDRAFCKDVYALPLVKRLAASADPAQFAELAAEMGLDVSQRSARRVMDGEIPEAEPLLERITLTRPDGKHKSGKAKRPASGAKSFKLSKADADDLAASVRAIWPDIARRYYLSCEVEPTVRSHRDRIVVTIPLADAD